jgi:putative SOS response-associated peptidase YedK
MCFSVQVDKDLKKLAKKFNATTSVEGFKAFEALRSFEAAQSPEKIKELLGLKRKPSSPIFKEADDKGRIYPGYWANIVIAEKGNRLIKPMRYRVRPEHSAEEIPSKYNVFNCRLDAIEKRKTWKSIFMKNHGLFPFKKFYEWVDINNKKTLIHFDPKEREIMWAPAIFDTWESPNGEIHFESFAIITDDPPQEVLAAGHDRCPIFLKEENIDAWLNPQDHKKDEILKLLKQKEKVYFESSQATH